MEISIGDTVRVLDTGCTYDTYHNWPDIVHVPHFAFKPGEDMWDGGELPETGKVYLVTHVGKHEHGQTLYVLDGRFIVSDGAFQEPDHDPWAIGYDGSSFH